MVNKQPEAIFSGGYPKIQYHLINKIGPWKEVYYEEFKRRVEKYISSSEATTLLLKGIEVRIPNVVFRLLEKPVIEHKPKPKTNNIPKMSPQISLF
jgi:hypothetical protein